MPGVADLSYKTGTCTNKLVEGQAVNLADPGNISDIDSNFYNPAREQEINSTPARLPSRPCYSGAPR